MSEKAQLISDIQQLLNTYDATPQTSINPDLLAFMDEQTLKSIIHDLLSQKERVSEENLEWLEQFKTPRDN